MYKYEEQSKEAENLLPRFVSAEFVARNIGNSNLEFSYLPLCVEQIEELKANVAIEALTSESKKLLAGDLYNIPIEYGAWMFFPFRKKYYN